MGPQPPLKRRPTYTPYTLPCKRDISAKLTPAGVGASTHTAHQQKAKLSSSLRIDIYIYIHARRYRGHESIPHCHKSRHISTITDSFPPCVLRGLPTGIRPCFPRIFSGFQLFHRFVIRASSHFVQSAAPSLFHLDASASFPLPFASPPLPFYPMRDRLIAFEKFNFDDTDD